MVAARNNVVIFTVHFIFVAICYLLLVALLLLWFLLWHINWKWIRSSCRRCTFDHSVSRMENTRTFTHHTSMHRGVSSIQSYNILARIRLFDSPHIFRDWFGRKQVNFYPPYLLVLWGGADQLVVICLFKIVFKIYARIVKKKNPDPKVVYGSNKANPGRR